MIIKGGTNQGTYTSELGVIKYASWISEYMYILIISVYNNSTISLSSDLNMALDTNVSKKDRIDYIGSNSNPGGHTSIGDYATLLSRGSGTDITVNKLFSILRKLGYLKTGRMKGEKNKPHQKYISRGYFTGYLVNVGKTTQVFVTLITNLGISEISDDVVISYRDVYCN